MVDGRLWGIVRVASTREDPLPADTETRLAAFTELVGTAIANAQARVELRRYADEQAALRRVATLVAGGAPPEEVFAAVAAEAGGLLGADLTAVARYETDAVLTLGAWSSTGTVMPFPVGARTSLGGQNLITLVSRTGRPVRMDDYRGATGAGADVGHDWGFRSAVGAPITVEGRLWGVMAVGPTRDNRLPADAEQRLTGFTGLAGTAIANAQARVELRHYADEEAALRRVATLVAGGAPPAEVFGAVAAETGRLLSADFAGLSRFDPDGLATAVGMWLGTDKPWPIAVGDRVALGGHNVPTLVLQRGQPVRIDDYDAGSGAFAQAARAWGFRSAVGVPITVGGQAVGRGSRGVRAQVGPAIRHRGAAHRVHRTGRHGDRQRGGAGRADGLARTPRHRCRRGQAAHRAGPARRCAAAPGHPRPPAPGNSGVGARRAGWTGEAAGRPGGERGGRAGGAARDRPRHPPRGAGPGRPASRAAGTGRPLPRPC